MDHELRRVSFELDLEFVYDRVRDLYGRNGNESVPPPVILKLMLLLVFYNVRSERELLRTLPYRLDWLWFLDYGLEDEIPHHSVLSKARARWGEAVFRELFERTVRQCVRSGLVDGKKLFMDSSLVDANTSKVFTLEMNAVQSDGMGGTNSKTFYITSLPDGIVFNANYYEDDLVKLPRYTRAMQNIFGGVDLDGAPALISFGSMVLDNKNGMYDDLLDQTWTAPGQAITGKIGGKELDFANYKTFLNGIVAGIRELGNNQIEVTIKDLMTTLVNKLKGAGTYTGTLDALIKTALTTDGGLTYPDDFNTTMWTTFESEYNYSVEVVLADPATLWAYIGLLTKNLLVFYGIGRDGKFEIGQLKAPTAGESVDTYQHWDLSKGTTKVKFLPIFWKVNIKWDNAGTPAVETTSDATIKTVNADAIETGDIETAITAQADAQTERDRRFNLFKVRRQLLDLNVQVQPFERHLNHVVKVDISQKTIDDHFRLIGLRDNLAKAECAMTLFK